MLTANIAARDIIHKENSFDLEWQMAIKFSDGDIAEIMRAGERQPVTSRERGAKGRTA